MAHRTPLENYFLIVLAVLVAVFGLIVMGSLAVTFSFIVALFGQSESDVSWLHVVGGLLFSLIAAAAALLLIKLVRAVERRGVLQPPNRQ